MPLHDQHPIPPIVSLRRNGDIISLLPLLKFMADANGQPVRLVVHRDYAGVLEGVSYGSMQLLGRPVLVNEINGSANSLKMS